LPLQCADVPEPIAVTVDIKPGSDTNPIQCRPPLHGMVPVAVLGTDEFDVGDLDHTTVRFGPSEASEAHNNPHGLIRHEEDVDGDGDLDLVFHFRLADTGIQCGDTEATLVGWTYDGREITGADAIQTNNHEGGATAAVERIQISPNPFNPATTMSFYTGHSYRVRVAVYDIRGRQVAELADRQYGVGQHSVKWQGRDSAGRVVPSGQYFFRIEAGGEVQMKKAMLLK